MDIKSKNLLSQEPIFKNKSTPSLGLKNNEKSRILKQTPINSISNTITSKI